MRVDLDSLASFSQMGDEGGTRAADSLETLTGIGAHCDLTRTALVDADGLAAFLGDASTRIAVGFTGALSGRAILSFDSDFAAHVAEELGMGEGALPEVANILTSGFVDNWAERADTTIDIQPPEPVTDSDLVQDAAVVDGCAFVFESRVALVGVDGTCRFAVLPDIESFLDYLADVEDGDHLTIEELRAYIELTAESATNVASHLAMVLGKDTNAVEAHLDFVPVERAPSLLDDTAYEGAVFESEGPVDSVIAVLFEESDAGEVTDAMLSASDPDPELEESAVAELGNITASGFVDQWANTLDTTIDISTPSHVHDEGRAVLDTVAAAYGQYADTISVVDATVDVNGDLTCRVVAFPSPKDADTIGEIAEKLSNREESDE